MQNTATPKTYFARTIMHRFPWPWGGEALFIGGKYTTSSAREQAELDAIIPPNGNNPSIFTLESVNAGLLPERPEQIPQNAKSDLEIAAADRSIQNSGMNTRVQNDPTSGAPQFRLPSAADVNQSTIDPNLVAAATGANGVSPIGGVPPIVGPGAGQQVIQPNPVEIMNTAVVNPSGTKLAQNHAEQAGGATGENEALAQIREAAAARTAAMLNEQNQNQGS